MKKTLNENYNKSINTNWKSIILILLSATLGSFVLILSILKSIENSQQIRIDPIANANQLTRKSIILQNQGSEYVFNVYIADNDRSRTTGLMNVKSIKKDEGMLFIFNDNEIRSFWMKDTYIPLDILFFDDTGKLINFFENATPLNESKRYVSESPAMFVLELKGGTIENLGLTQDILLIQE